MKKVIAIVAIVVIALVGLTSYNGSEMKKNNERKTLIAELKSGGNQLTDPKAGDKKKD